MYKKIKYIILILSFITLLFSSFSFSQEREKIVSFDSLVEVHKDGMLRVTETIKVLALGHEIKRGIYRDFPTKYTDSFGNRYQVDFTLLGALRNGYTEQSSVVDTENGVRIYLGNKNFYLPAGEYTYTIEYLTNWQVGFFKNFDELYWNVTGNYWSFPIQQASCTIKLPTGAVVNFSDAYTGLRGARGKDFVVSRDWEDDIVFTTTRTLGAGEGISILVRWPKGFVNEPTTLQKFIRLIDNNLGVILGFIGLILLSAYYLFIWYSVGRDPKKGVIIPLYRPPDNISAAASRYIMRMGYDDKIFASCVINMAVKGYLNISEERGEYTLVRLGRSDIVLTKDEQVIADALFEGSQDVFILSNTNHEKMQKAISALKKTLSGSYEKNYFITNSAYFIYGIVISAAVLLLSEFIQAGSMVTQAIFMTIWLAGWSGGVIALSLAARSEWLSVFSSGIKFIPKAIFITIFSIPFIIGEIVGLYFLSTLTSAIFIVLFLCTCIINAVFYHLLKAPTALGRRLMDKIEGFRMYLSVAERDELKTMQLNKNPELFERYLPYALALNVEQQWSEKFADVLVQASVSGASYHPVWYSSSSGGIFNASNFSSSLGSSFTNAISSSSHAPGSGGSGGSGGGGGGGGGGGW